MKDKRANTWILRLSRVLATTFSCRGAPTPLPLPTPPPEEHDEIRKSGFWYYQTPTHDFYRGTNCQIFVAILIFLNFGITVIQAQLDPFNVKYVEVWFIIDVLFTTCFTIELIVNMWECQSTVSIKNRFINFRII